MAQPILNGKNIGCPVDFPFQSSERWCGLKFCGLYSLVDSSSEILGRFGKILRLWPEVFIGFYKDLMPKHRWNVSGSGPKWPL